MRAAAPTAAAARGAEPPWGGAPVLNPAVRHQPSLMLDQHEEQIEGAGAQVHRLSRQTEHAFRGVELEGSDAYQVHVRLVIF